MKKRNDISKELSTPKAADGHNKRREPRFPAKGKIKILYNENSIMILKDLSLHGGSAQGNGLRGITAPNEKYQVEIIPEEESQIDSFITEIVARWFRNSKTQSHVGFAMDCENEELANYIRYLEANQKTE